MVDVSTEMIKIQETASNSRLFFSSFILFIHGIGIGCGYVHGSLILPYQTGDKGNSTLVQLTEDEGSWSVSITPLGQLLGILVANIAGEQFGRKPVLILSDVVTIIGYIIIYFSKNFPVFMMGRVVVSLGQGFGIMMIFILISEITTIKWQGPLSNINLCSICYGISFLYVLAILVNIDYLIYFACLFPLIFILLSPLLPESPQWLIRNGQTEKASQIYTVLRGKTYKGTKQEIEEIKFCISSKNSSSPTSTNRWTSRRFLHPLAILLPMFLFIALCGFDAPLNLYGPIIFQKVGLDMSPAIISAIVALGQTVGYTLVFPLMTRINRRPLYLSACVLMSLSSFLLSLSIQFSMHPSPSIPRILTQILMAISAFLITFGYGLGFGAVTYAVPGELLSPDDKSIGITLAQAVRMIGTFAVLKVYPTLLQHVSLSVLFGCHGAFIVLAALFSWKFLPETKDKSITEMHLHFTK